MDTTQIMQWVGPALDVMAVALLAAVLWRLGREPGAAWSEREARLQAIFDDLRTLVAQSEGLARDLDGKLAGREERLRALLAEAQATVGGRVEQSHGPAERPTRIEVRADDEPARPTDITETARQIESLAEAGTGVEEIARRVGVAAAEVRLVIGLKAARAARRRAPEVRAHA